MLLAFALGRWLELASASRAPPRKRGRGALAWWSEGGHDAAIDAVLACYFGCRLAAEFRQNGGRLALSVLTLSGARRWKANAWNRSARWWLGCDCVLVCLRAVRVFAVSAKLGPILESCVITLGRVWCAAPAGESVVVVGDDAEPPPLSRSKTGTSSPRSSR